MVIDFVELKVRVKDKNINCHELITNFFRYFCDFCVT
jgi:hypothetical protein